MSTRMTKTQVCQGCGRRVRELRRVVGAPGHWRTYDPTAYNPATRYYGDPSPEPQELCFSCAPPPMMMSEAEARAPRRPWGLKNITAKAKRANRPVKQHRCGVGVAIDKTGHKRAHAKKADR